MKFRVWCYVIIFELICRISADREIKEVSSYYMTRDLKAQNEELKQILESLM